MMARMMEKLPGHLHHHRNNNNNNKTAIDPVVVSDDNGSEATDSDQKKEQTKLLWTGLGRSKARKPSYNQAGKYKTTQHKIGQYWRTRSSTDPSTGVGLLEGCPPNHLLL
jgi:hypothetical protein